MADSSEILTQEKYNSLVYGLDGVMLTMRNMGKTEDEARKWLLDFVTGHYIPVWRKMVRSHGQSAQGK